MSDDAEVVALAARAGLEVEWVDAKGEPRTVGLDSLKAVLEALDLPARSSAETSESLARLQHDEQSIPSLQVVDPAGEVRIAKSVRAQLLKPDGTHAPIRLRPLGEGETAARAPREPGYYQIECDKGQFAFAVAPRRALRPQDLGKKRKLAGVATQIYSLPGGTSGSFGDFASLASFAEEAGRSGIDAVMVSPTHALFGADPGSFNPYSPSTRLFYNPLFADVTLEGLPPAQNTESGELIDWQQAGPAKYQQLRATFARFRGISDDAGFVEFCRAGGERLLAHALFEALDAKFRKEGVFGFPNWPAAFGNPLAAGARAYRRDATEEIQYQLFLQWLSARSAAAAQKAARKSMVIGIIADIAVGVDPQGSHAWSSPDELLRGLHVGAPPDIFNTRGQDWGLTTFSPHALRTSGYDPFLKTLHANMAQAGGVRIDHALGMRRLWVIPSGASPADGVYLRYPQRELLKLTALESQLNRAIVVGEDLGTVPEGFRDELGKQGVLGMQVLWFERDHDGGFISHQRWRRDAAAMTTTHDLPTVAGWWSGRDIDWQVHLDRLRAPEIQERDERAEDRERLWSAFRRARCATGTMPAVDEPEPVITAALQFVGKSHASIAIAAVEDIVGEPEQPNLPDTLGEHPNWRRRIQKHDLLRDTKARIRLDALISARKTM